MKFVKGGDDRTLEEALADAWAECQERELEAKKSEVYGAVRL